MPIIIPSKNIYGRPSINRVKKPIGTVEVQYYEAKREEENDIVVYSTSISAVDLAVPELRKDDFFASNAPYDNTSNRYHRVQAFSYTDYLPYYSNLLLHIPISADKKTITDVFYGKDENGSYNISVTFGGYLEKGTVTCSVNFDSFVWQTIEEKDDVISNISYQKTSSEYYDSYTPIIELSPYKVSNNSITASSKVDISVRDREETVVKKEAEGIIGALIQYVYSGYWVTKIGGTREVNVASTTGAITEVSSSVFGEYEKFIPTKATITINGNAISLNLEQKVARYEEGSGDSFKVEGNELMQDTTVVPSESEPYVTAYANRILKQYNGGKGTGEINCSIFPVLVGAIKNGFSTSLSTIDIDIQRSGEMFILNGIAEEDQTANLATTTLKKGVYRLEAPTIDGLSYIILKPSGSVICLTSKESGVKTFEIAQDKAEIRVQVAIEKGTVLNNYIITETATTESLVIPIGATVVPMYMKPNGEDAPFFVKQNGTPSSLLVVGAEVYYDGATMQRLKIKEM